ncbi:monocarboxylate transporter 2-like [Brachionus plicatilis]|uniref:Monocarboxylate transporter 2-like n=1 Tax=Brachionus plicatilis TaxID=10195 RepID=A0A3M7S732_BRAPC|nr:monocarboxylate transporter 2-like [Brachionus plicatilis]
MSNEVKKESKELDMDKKKFIKPDGGYGWVILFVAFSISFVMDGCMYSFGIVLDEIKNHYNATQEVANLIPSLNTGFLFLSGPVSAALAKQFGCRPVVMAGSLIFSLMYFVSPYLPSIYLMKFSFGIIGDAIFFSKGISFGCAYLTNFIILVDYFDRRLGFANGLTMSGSGLGNFAYAPLTKFLIEDFKWQNTMLILGGTIFLCTFLGALLRPIEHYYKKVNQNEDLDETSDEKKEEKNVSSVVKNLLKEMTNFKILKLNFSFLLITLSNFFIFFVYFIPFIYIPIRAKDLQIAQFAWLISIIGIVNIPMRIIFGIISDRKIIRPIHMNTLCIFFASGSMYSYFYLATFYHQAVATAVFGMAAAGINSLTTPYLVDIVGSEAFANANGILNMFRGLSCIFGPFIAGFLSEKLKSNLYAFVFCGTSLALAGILSFFVSIITTKSEKNTKSLELVKI